MASNFITQKEVIDISFQDKTVNRNAVSEDFISLAEESHIRPLLGDDFFDRLNQASPSPVFNAYETALLVLIKKSLAYFVKYEIIPHMAIKITNTGVHLPETHNAVVGGLQERRESRSACLRTAQMLSDIAKRYMVDNSTNLDYFTASETVQNTHRNYGGVIF